MHVYIGEGRESDKTFGSTSLQTIRPKDFYIRDLGYCDLHDLQKIHDKGAYYVTNGYIYVFKTHDNRLYQYYAEGASKDCWVMKEIYDDELNDLPVASYELIETEEREIPEKDLMTYISWEKLLDPNRECDFYYSDKMFAMSSSANEGRYNVVNINRE